MSWMRRCRRGDGWTEAWVDGDLGTGDGVVRSWIGHGKSWCGGRRTAAAAAGREEGWHGDVGCRETDDSKKAARARFCCCC